LKPIDTRSINRTIKKHQNLDTINNPTTITDHKNRGKLLAFIGDVKKLEIRTQAVIMKLWSKQRCNSKNPSYYNLIDLVEHFNKTG
jgi:hypothetical protein